MRCGPLSGDGGGGSDELEALLLDGDDAMRRAWIVACEVGARYLCLAKFWPMQASRTLYYLAVHAISTSSATTLSPCMFSIAAAL